MIRRRSILPILISLTVGSVGLAAQDVIGEVVFVDGFPQFTRDGIELAESIDFGYPVENFDTVTTDGRSELEIAIDPVTGIDLSIVVDPDTSLYLDLSSYRRQQRGVVELLSGTINVTARELREGSGFVVNTPTATMGVRGTTFSVTAAPGGGILVLPEEGVVEVNTVGGRQGFARIGQAIEIDADRGELRSLRFDPSERERFRRLWSEERLEELRERGPELVRELGVQYQEHRDRFVSAYSELMQQRPLLDQWMEQARRRIQGDPDAVERQVEALSPVLLQLRVRLRTFEQLFTRLEQLRTLVPAEAMESEVATGVTVEEIYRMVGSDRAVMLARFSEIRHALKLFAGRNNGVVPRSLLDDME